MRPIILLLFLLLIESISAQGPEVTSWIINTDGSTGYNGIETNVLEVQYSNSYVYVSTNSVPSYSIGPWSNNPNDATSQGFTFKIPRNPIQNTGALTETPLGHTGIWTNGVSIYNAEDGMSYNNQGVWYRNAYYFEGVSFDECLGHPSPNGEYHHHISPTCLYDATDDQTHSPIIGYAWDGFPIYGAYGYSNTDGTGGIRRMESSFTTRNIADRTTLPDGSALSANEYGPAISAQYPLGAFLEDYEYVSGLGDLDASNGRYCITPEYPSGTYAYFVTLDENLDPAYPYTPGPLYYGVVEAVNIGPQSGNSVPTETVQTYIPEEPTGINHSMATPFSIWPNPCGDFLRYTHTGTGSEVLKITDVVGREVLIRKLETDYIDVSKLAAGQYNLHLQKKNGEEEIYRFIKI